MVNSEYYIDFIDGTLSYENEMEFVHLLSRDDEFRKGFRSFLKIKSVISSNISSYSAPLEEKASIFAALGYALPEEVLYKPIEKSIPFYKKPFFKHLGTFILSSLLTIMLYSFFINDKVANQSAYNTANISSLNDANRISQNIPNTSNRANTYSNNLLNEREFSAKQNPLVKHTIYASNDMKTQNKNENFAENKEDSEKIVERNEMIENSNPDYLAQNILNTKDEIKLNPKQNFQNYDTVFLIRSYDSRMIFEMKNTPAWYFNEPLVKQERPSKFEDLSLGIFYPIYKGLLLGLEYKQETFYVEYEGKDEKGQNAIIYKDPNIVSLGLNARYGSFLITEKLKPLVQLGFLFNKYGFISKEMIGLEYNPYDFMYFVIGAELNSFFYQHENQWNISNKFSFNYGMGIRF